MKREACAVLIWVPPSSLTSGFHGRTFLECPSLQADVYDPHPSMSQERPPDRRTNLRNLNWFGKTVYLGGSVLRLTANLVDATAERVSRIAAESKEAFERELDPNIEDARVIEEYPHPESSRDE